MEIDDLSYDYFEKGENPKKVKKQSKTAKTIIKCLAFISLGVLLIVGSVMWRSSKPKNKLFSTDPKKITFADLGVKVPEIILPKKLDTKTWATIACDQYTQDREYWKKVEETVGTNPSTLKITFPEVYLNDPGKEERIKNIKTEMDKYMKEGIFAEPKEEMIYIERKTAYGRTRKGLITAIDLETYEWKPFSKSLIRATEQTIVERIPPRIVIRRGAPLELPHILLLINDKGHKFVEGAGRKVMTNKPIYEGELMMDSGSIKGWEISKKEDLDYLKEQLAKVAIENTMKDGSVFLFAVGDGNHSLATAKAIWEEYKKAHPEDKESKLRYALVEIENIYDEGMVFEPIHRVLFNIKPSDLIGYLKKELKGAWHIVKNEKSLKIHIKKSDANFGFVYKDKGKTVYGVMTTRIRELPVSRLQPAIDKFLDAKLKRKATDNDIDFIHGDDEIFRLGEKENTLTIMLPPISKTSLFPTVSNLGPLPRKSFSMGEASEKRFYLECRNITE